MQTQPDHITFRPGALTERLTRGPLSPGATAKNDLNRFYVLVNTQFDLWRKTVGDDTWDVLVAFVSTRAWETIPYPVPFQDQLASFLRSPMAKDFSKVAKGSAYAALVGATYADIVAIVDHAEESALNLALSTVGATSAADAVPRS